MLINLLLPEFLPQILTAAIPSIRVVSVSTNLQDVDAEVSFDV
jgi:hypothetical protein